MIWCNIYPCTSYTLIIRVLLPWFCSYSMKLFDEKKTRGRKSRVRVPLNQEDVVFGTTCFALAACRWKSGDEISKCSYLSKEYSNWCNATVFFCVAYTIYPQVIVIIAKMSRQNCDFTKHYFFVLLKILFQRRNLWAAKIKICTKT
jgi:hypothetical protein